MLSLEQESSVISGEIFVDMTKVVFTNIQSKFEINASCPTLLPLCKKFARSVHFQCCYTSLLLKYLPISLIRIKEIEIKDHGIRILNFAHDTTIFLKNSTCHSRIQVIWKLCEDASSSKINFLKVKPYGLKHIEFTNQDKWNGHRVRISVRSKRIIDKKDKPNRGT